MKQLTTDICLIGLLRIVTLNFAPSKRLFEKLI